MEKFRKYLDKWKEGKKTPGLSVPSYELLECEYIYSALERGEHPTTFSKTIKNVLDKCGIKTTEKDIGWIIG